MTGYAVLVERALKAVLGHGIVLTAAKSVSANELPSIVRVFRKEASEVKTSARTAAKSTLLRVDYRNTVRNVRISCTKSLTLNNPLNTIAKTKK